MAILALASVAQSFAETGISQKTSRVNGLMLKHHRLNHENGGWGEAVDKVEMTNQSLPNFGLTRRLQLSLPTLWKSPAHQSFKQSERWTEQLVSKIAAMYTLKKSRGASFA